LHAGRALRGMLAMDVGDTEQGENLLLAALQHYQKSGAIVRTLRLRLELLMGRAITLLDPEMKFELEEILRQCIKHGWTDVSIEAKLAYVQLLLWLGENREAMTRAREMLDLCTEYQPVCMLVLARLSQALVALGKAEEAMVYAERAIKLLAGTGSWQGEIEVRYAWAQVMNRLGKEGGRLAIDEAQAALRARLKLWSEDQQKLAVERVPLYHTLQSLGAKPVWNDDTQRDI